MFRHVIAPRRFFLQVPNDVIRHPRLNSDAKALLLYVLSLPEGADESLQKSAERAGLKKSAFTAAKRQLLAEGYVHEWREQGAGGRWGTAQLVANVPLSRAEADVVRRGDVPSARKPAVGQPRRRAVGHSQQEEPENTPNLPPSPPAPQRDPGQGADRATSPPETGAVPAGWGVAPSDGWGVEPLVGAGGEVPGEPPAGSGAGPSTESLAEPDGVLVREAAAVLAAVSHGEPRLQLGGREIARLAPQAAEWLAHGCSPERLKVALTTGLPCVVLNPAGFVRDRLRRKMPLPAPRSAAPPLASEPERAAGIGARLTECRNCRDPLPRGCRDEVCRGCAEATPLSVPHQYGMAAVRAVLGGGLGAAFALP